MDYIHYGITRRFYENPPQIENEQALVFEDGIRSTATDKIRELTERMDFLEEQKARTFTLIDGADIRDNTALYFSCLLANLEYAEIFAVQKWLNYWMDLLAVVDEKWKKIREEQKDDGDLTNAQIGKAKAKSIEQMFSGRLSQTGSRFIGKCPFHEDNSPSFVIYDNNTFFCFGCQISGDAIDFYAKTHKLNFREAVLRLA